MKSVQDYKGRNVGIDLLRMLSMFMIVVLHVLNKGGVVGSTEILSAHYVAAWLLEIFTLCAVNCFAIISGYVGINAKYKYSNFVNLWLRVVFYTMFITLLFVVYRGGGTKYLGEKRFSGMFQDLLVCNSVFWAFPFYAYFKHSGKAFFRKAV